MCLYLQLQQLMRIHISMHLHQHLIISKSLILKIWLVEQYLVLISISLISDGVRPTSPYSYFKLFSVIHEHKEYIRSVTHIFMCDPKAVYHVPSPIYPSCTAITSNSILVLDPLIAKGTSSSWGSALALGISSTLLLCWNFPFSVPCLFLLCSLIFTEHRGFLRNSEWKETFQRTLRSKILYLHWHLMDNFVKHRIPGEKVLSFRDWRAVPHCLQALLVAVENSRTALIPDCLWCSVCFISSIWFSMLSNSRTLTDWIFTSFPLPLL